jgi:hypothetical protein
LLSGLLNLRTANGHGRLRDDALSVVLSKAFPLAADDEIKDASIRQQISSGGIGRVTATGRRAARYFEHVLRPLTTRMLLSDP